MVKEGEEMGCSCSGACMRERERERGEYEGVMAAVVREKERRKRYGCYFLHGCMQLKVE
jgi:hypothetical protein